MDATKSSSGFVMIAVSFLILVGMIFIHGIQTATDDGMLLGLNQNVQEGYKNDLLFSELNHKESLASMKRLLNQVLNEDDDAEFLQNDFIQLVMDNFGSRNLAENEDRPCGEAFSIVSREELGFVMDSILSLTFRDVPDVEEIKFSFLRMLQYDLIVGKACISCADIVNQGLINTTGTSDTGSMYGFDTYCNESSYGYEATHSALVFAPMDRTTGQIINGVSLRGFVYARSVIFDVENTLSLIWPKNVTELLLNEDIELANKLFAFIYFLTSTTAASAGAISIVPDFIGYGESNNYNRTLITPLPYMQAFATSWIATQQYISNISNGCTELEDVATIAGYSEGGYSSIVGALALNDLNIRILSLHAGGGPYNLPLQFTSTLERIRENPSFSLRLLTPFIAYSYSNNFDFMPNYNTGQYLLAEEWMDSSNITRDVVRWFTSPDPLSSSEVFTYMPLNPSDILNPDIVASIEAALDNNDTINACTDTYVTNSTDKLCEAFRDASLWDALENDITFPTFICHSEQDEVVGYVNVPPSDVFENNQNLNLYQPENDALVPRGDHGSSNIFCNLGALSRIGFTIGDDTPTKMTPSRCFDSNVPSESPTESPTDIMEPETDSTSPSISPTEMMDPGTDSSSPSFLLRIRYIVPFTFICILAML